MKVGSSKVLKTDVRIVAATNVDIPSAIHSGKFREDLYYRLNTVPIQIPTLRQRKDDVHLLFRKFAGDFAERYKMPTVKLGPKAINLLEDYRWPGNVRQLKNVTEQLSILEKNKEINAEILLQYLPEDHASNLPVLLNEQTSTSEYSERELLYKVLFDMKKDINELKKLVVEMINSGAITGSFRENNSQVIEKLYEEVQSDYTGTTTPAVTVQSVDENYVEPPIEIEEESLSLEEKEKEMIKRAIEKHKGKHKHAAH